MAGTSVWCDAGRARGLTFISRPEVILGRGRADRVVTTELASVLRRAIGLPCEEPLLPRYGRPFALGRARVELLPSGGAPGGAQLLIELGGWRGLYAGQVCLRAITGIEPVQLRACDELVLDAPIAGGIVDGRDALLRAVAALGAGRAVGAVNGPVQVEIDQLAALGATVAILGPERVVAAPRWRKAARAWVGLPALAGLMAGSRRPLAGSLSIFLGGRPATAPPGSVGLGLLPSAAELARYAVDCEARQVWVRVDGSAARLEGAQALLGALAALGIPAAPLAPPEQLPLFPPPRR